MNTLTVPSRLKKNLIYYQYPNIGKLNGQESVESPVDAYGETVRYQPDPNDVEDYVSDTFEEG